MKCRILALALLATTVATAAQAEDSPFLSNIRQVTTGFEKAGEGYFSPDGKTIIYQAIRREYPFYQIYTQKLSGDSPRPKLISTGRGRTTCAYFSPDGKRLLFASSHLDPKLYETEEGVRKQQEADRKSGRRRRYSWDFDPYMEIFEANLNGKILKRLTKAHGYDAEGAYSKDGKKIAFCSSRDGDADIYIMNSDGTNVKQLTNVKGYDGGPFISPNGKWVIYRTDRKKEHHLQIHVIGVDGKNDTALTTVPNWVNWGPYWHPNKPYIIWSGANHATRGRPNYDLWLAKYEVKNGKFTRGKIHRVTTHRGADVLPVFSPDGKKLMWTSTRTKSRTSQLFIADFKLP